MSVITVAYNALTLDFSMPGQEEPSTASQRLTLTQTMGPSALLKWAPSDSNTRVDIDLIAGEQGVRLRIHSRGERIGTLPSRTCEVLVGRNGEITVQQS
jgi:hypothetical protein